jgi:hypothetical protein
MVRERKYIRMQMNHYLFDPGNLSHTLLLCFARYCLNRGDYRTVLLSPTDRTDLLAMNTLHIIALELAR